MIPSYFEIETWAQRDCMVLLNAKGLMQVAEKLLKHGTRGKFERSQIPQRQQIRTANLMNFE